MKKYDVVVIGSGAALSIVNNALQHGLSTALIDRGPLGGTCLNVGCIPSKMILYPADRVVETREAAKLGITAEIRGIDFTGIMDRMRKTVAEGESHIRESIRLSEDLDFYEGQGFFTGDHILEVNGEKLRGEKIFIATGARPHVPEIPGIEKIEYLTNETILLLRELPESMVILGGGYIAAEYAHFFDAMGTKVIMIQKNRRLLPDEEPEVSALLEKRLGLRMKVLTDTEAISVRKSGEGYEVTSRTRSTGKEKEFQASKILAATGRTSNADILKVKASGISTDERNFITVNEHFETSRKGIWAFGDALGRKMFRHAANRQATIVWHNALHDGKGTFDFSLVPHAVFTSPEIASIGLTEEEARRTYHPGDLLIGKAVYSDVARGEAMMEEEAFGKAIVTRKDGKILGFHIIGPSASILIQEVVLAMSHGMSIWDLDRGMHIHPALSELIIATFGKLKAP